MKDNLLEFHTKIMKQKEIDDLAKKLLPNICRKYGIINQDIAEKCCEQAYLLAETYYNFRQKRNE